MKNKIILALFFLLALMVSWSAFAAVTANSPVTCQTPNRGIVQFLQGTDAAGTYKTAYTGETTNGAVSDIYSIMVNNNDASATHVVTCQIVNSAVKYGGAVLTTVSPAASSFMVQALLNVTLWPGIQVSSDGTPLLRLVSGDTLQCTFATALTASDVINVYVEACDY